MRPCHAARNLHLTTEEPMRIHLLTLSALLGLLPVAALSQERSTDTQPGLKWTEERLREVAHHVRAGRKLTPRTWPGGARVAVCLSFDPDNFSIPLNRGDNSP